MKKIFLKKKAFTLIELLIVMAMIAMFVIGISSLDFSSMSNKQKSEMLANKIMSQIEEARNNALVGRGQLNSGTLTLTKTWKIIIDKSANSIISKRDDEIHKTFKLDGQNQVKENINSIKCGTNNIATLEISFEGQNSKITSSPSNICKIQTSFSNSFPFIIQFDSVTGLLTKSLKK